MLTPILDSLLIFSIITPVIGSLIPKKFSRLLSGIFAVIGLSFSAAFLYIVFPQISAKPMKIPIQAGLLHANLILDLPGFFAAFLTILLSISVAIYSIRFMERDAGVPLYYALLILMTVGMIGSVFSGDLFTLFVFWELMCVSSYVLVGFRRTEKAPVEAAVKYMVMSAAGSATILFGISILYGLAGTLNLVELASALSSANGEPWLYLTLIILIAGFGIKAAIVPLHTWLPDAYAAAPSSVSAIIAGASTEIAVFVICKLLFFILPALSASWVFLFAAFSVLNMLLGNVVGLLQHDIKRMLAYSSIAHIGYIFIGVAAGTKLGLTAALLHIFNHGLLKALAFLCIGAIIYRLGAGDLDEISGIGRKMPITASAFIIAILGLIGMPPLNGFISKLFLFMSSLDSGMLWLGILLVIFSAVSTGYYLRILKTLIAAPSSRVVNVKEAPITMLVPVCVLAVLVVVLGVWPDPLLGLAKEASTWLMEVEKYVGGF